MGIVHTALVALLLLASGLLTRVEGAAAGGENLGVIRIAAERGLPRSQFKLGNHYAAEGAYTLAAAWYRRAAERGHGEAQLALAHCYREGLGIKQSVDEANRWSALAKAQLGSTADFWSPVEREEVQAEAPVESPLPQIVEVANPAPSPVPQPAPVQPLETDPRPITPVAGEAPGPDSPALAGDLIDPAHPVSDPSAPLPLLSRSAAVEPGPSRGVERGVEEADGDERVADQILAGLLNHQRRRMTTLEAPTLMLEQLEPVTVAYDPPLVLVGKTLASARESNPGK